MLSMLMLLPFNVVESEAWVLRRGPDNREKRRRRRVGTGKCQEHEEVYTRKYMSDREGVHGKIRS